MALRIPLPVKLMLSYLVVVAFGAGPTFVYVRAKLQDDLLADSASTLLARSRRMARSLAAAAADEQLSLLRLLGQTDTDRITFLSPHGDVLYDSEIGNPLALENHLGRPEVSYALGNTAAPRPRFAATINDSGGAGITRRVSASSGIDTLYVAVLAAGLHGESLGVLRLATPVGRISAMTGSMMRFVRNALAVAVSLAIGFSMLAAVLFVRPLQRVSGLVNALAAGDIGAQVGDLGNDEVGDVGRALEQMALSLRQRLLAAGLGEAMIVQLVEALPTPCVVFEESGDVVAVNGAARRSLCIEGPEAGKRMKDLAEHKDVQRAIQCAEDEGEPEPITLPLGAQGVAQGVLHVLKRPGMAPLRVFIGAEAPASEPSLLPLPEEVAPRPLEAVFRQARQAAQAALTEAGLALEIPPHHERVQVADAREQLGLALGETLRAAAVATSGGQEALRIEIADDGLRIRLRLDAAIAPKPAQRIRLLLTPLGGAIEVLSDETRLWLPRA